MRARAKIHARRPTRRLQCAFLLFAAVCLLLFFPALRVCSPCASPSLAARARAQIQNHCRSERSGGADPIALRPMASISHPPRGCLRGWAIAHGLAVPRHPHSNSEWQSGSEAGGV